MGEFYKLEELQRHKVVPVTIDLSLRFVPALIIKSSYFKSLRSSFKSLIGIAWCNY